VSSFNPGPPLPLLGCRDDNVLFSPETLGGDPLYQAVSFCFLIFFLEDDLVVALCLFVEDVITSVCVEINRFVSGLLQAAWNSNELPSFCPDLRINDLLAHASLIEAEIPGVLGWISDQIWTPWQQRVLLQCFSVLLFVHKIKMARIIIREEFFADVWGPEIGWGLRCASEPCLKLARVVHRSKIYGVTFSG